MVRGIVIPADPDRPVYVRDFADPYDYKMVVDGWIEAVDIPPLEASLLVNDEGLLRRLPFNARATFLWWYELPQVRQQVTLVGDAVMVGLPGLDGESTDLPSSTLTLLIEKTPWSVVTLVEGSPFWLKHPFAYEDYFDAAVWAMMLSDAATGTRAVRIITMDQLHDMDMKEVADQENWGDLD
jgi:hypothetical protein